MKKRLLSVLVALTLVLGLIPVVNMTANAGSDVPEGYTAGENGIMAYKSDANGDYDFIGYVNNVWNMVTHEGNGFSAATYNGGGNLTVSAKPTFIADGNAIQMDYTVKNTGSEAVSDYRFYLTADTELLAEEDETVTTSVVNDGVLTMTRDTVSFFAYSATDGGNPVVTAYMYDDDESLVSYESILTGRLLNREVDPSKVQPDSWASDKALVWYFGNDTLAAGATKTYTIVVGMSEASKVSEAVNNAKTGGDDSSGDGDSSGSDTKTKNIQLGTSAIKSPTKVDNNGNIDYETNSYVYFGMNSGNPMKWRVLDAEKANDKSTKGIFMLADNGISCEEFGNTNNYQDSKAKLLCTAYASDTNRFSATEQGTMLAISKTESSLFGAYGIAWSPSNLSGDKLFLPSMMELRDYVANYNGASGLTSNLSRWYTRSAPSSGSQVGILNYEGKATTYAVGSGYDANLRPATNLDPSKILFTSAAVGGKSASGMDNGLTAVTNYTGSDWKLTLLDSSMTFNVSDITVNYKSISNNAATVKAGDAFKLQYVNCANSGEDRWAAMIVSSSGEVLYYGRFWNSGLWGSVEMTIPKLAGGEYTLKVFREKCNADYKTDYASAFYDVKLTVESTAEAKIGDVEYETFAAALTAAANNTTADVIKVAYNAKMTLAGEGTLKAGDAIALLDSDGDEDGRYTAITDTKVSVYKPDEEESAADALIFNGGKIQLGKFGAAYFTNGAAAIASTGVEITALAENGDKLLAVYTYPDDEESPKVDVVMIPGTVKVKIGDTVYENACETYTLEDEDGIAVIAVVENSGNNLMSGSVKLSKNVEITAGKKVKNTGDKAITVAVDSDPNYYYYTATVPTGGKAKIGDFEYEVGDNGATLVIGEEYETLAKGSVKLSKSKAIVVGEKNTLVLNTGDKAITVSAENDGTGKTTIPQGGKTKINGTEIVATEGSVNVSIGTDGTSTVTVKPGKVTIGAMTYTDDVILSIDNNGNVTAVKGNVTFDESVLESNNFAYALLPGQSATLGKYTYTAPVAGSNGDVTISSRGANNNPAVILKNVNSTVDVSLSNDKNTKTTYTAAAANTKFAMADGDTNTKNIKLLTNGTNANSKIKVTAGVTVNSNISPMTSAANNTVIGLDSSNNAKLESGAASTAGSMFAVINGETQLFGVSDEGNTKPYTVNASDNTLNVPKGLTVTNYTSQTGAQFTNGTFTFGKNEDGTTVKVSAGASITGRNWEENSSTITGADDGNTIVSIYDDYGSICLIRGKGRSTGVMDVEIGENTWTFASEGKKYTVDTDGALTLDEAGTVTLEDEVRFTGKESDSFTFDTDDYTATIPEDATVAGNGITIKGIARKEGGKDTKVAIGYSDDKYTLTLVEGAGIVTVANAGDEFTMGNKTYVTADDETVFSVDDEGNVKLLRGSVKLKDGESIIGISGKLITNPADSDDDELIIAVKDDEDIVTVPTKGGKVTIGDTEYETAADNTTIVIDDNGNKLTGGAVNLDDGESIIGASGKLIANPADSDDDKLILAVEDGKDTVTVPTKGGKVTIGDTEYETAADNTTIVIDDNGNKLTGGAVNLDDGESIIGISGKLITNPADSGSDKVVLAVENGKDTVKVPAGGKVEIGGVVYTAGTDGVTLTVGSDGNVSVTAGSLKSTKSPKTGDDIMMALWVTLLLLSGAVVGTTVYSKKKRRAN